jgi:NitT/TauT family transport system permease protein
VKKTQSIVIWLLYICAWQLGAMLIHRSILLPSFFEVLNVMIQQATQTSLYLGIFSSLLRVIVGLLFALGLAMALALLTSEYPKSKVYFKPLLFITKTIPNITYILLILVWFSREISVSIITLFILFPVLYSHISVALEGIYPRFKDVWALYPESFIHKLIKVLLPLSKDHLVEAITTALSLGFKVGIMAELLGQVSPGLGYLLYTAKLNVDTVALFAYTAWLIISVLIVEKGLKKILKKE